MVSPEWEILANQFKIITDKIRSLELSLLLILFAAAFLYFGRIIGDTRVEKYDRINTIL